MRSCSPELIRASTCETNNGDINVFRLSLPVVLLTGGSSHPYPSGAWLCISVYITCLVRTLTAIDGGSPPTLALLSFCVRSRVKNPILDFTPRHATPRHARPRTCACDRQRPLLPTIIHSVSLLQLSAYYPVTRNTYTLSKSLGSRLSWSNENPNSISISCSFSPRLVCTVCSLARLARLKISRCGGAGGSTTKLWGGGTPSLDIRSMIIGVEM